MSSLGGGESLSAYQGKSPENVPHVSCYLLSQQGLSGILTLPEAGLAVLGAWDVAHVWGWKPRTSRSAQIVLPHPSLTLLQGPALELLVKPSV